MGFVYEQCGNCSRKGVYLVPGRDVARCKYCTASDDARNLHPSSLPAVAAGLHAHDTAASAGRSQRVGVVVPIRGEVRMEGGVLPMDMATISVLTESARSRSSRRSTPAPSGASRPRAEGARPRALVVDDDDTVRSLMVAALVRDGIAVTEASDGDEACAAMLAEPPDITVLDLGLPGMDGLEVLVQLRSRGDVGIMVVSGRSNEGDRIVALELGADDYLAKPFSPVELTARARAVMARRAR